jgi:hypothetical protein
MRFLAVLPFALVGAALIPGSASAEIVKAPTGEQSRLTVNSATMKVLKRGKVTVTISGAAKKSGTSFALPYSLSRWDFAKREGDVAHFAKNTGIKLRRGKRSVAVVHPRLIMDTTNSGYITALIANERIKVFTVSASGAKVTDGASLQQIDGLKLKLTQAGANYVNRGLKRTTLKRFSQFGTLDLRLIKPAGGPSAGGGGAGTGTSDTPGQGDTPGGTATINPGFLGLLPGGGKVTSLIPPVSQDIDGDGNPDVGLVALPLEGATFDADTRTGTIQLGGGLVIDLPAGGQVSLVNPEIVIGATNDTSGLYATIDGVRVKVGDIDTSKLNFNIGEGTVTINDLDVTVGGALSPLLNGALGNLIPTGTPLLSLDLSFPEL